VAALKASSNPYQTGIGLAIETRLNLSAIDNAAIVDASRSPVLRSSSTTQIRGNRPLIISRNDDVNGLTSTLLSVTPFGNTSIGSPIGYPYLSINYLIK
jgi:hypothetical protein